MQIEIIRNMYYERLIESEIKRKMMSSGAVLVAGPKFCGKTTTCMLFQKSFVKLNTKQAITMARMNPKGALNGDKPRLIDEWQKAPDIWNQVRDDLDTAYEFGKYILTGSSTPADKTEIHHSGAGRITPITMRPMSLWESKESNGQVSLSHLFDNTEDFPWELNEEWTIDDVAHVVCRGGWPISVLAQREIAVEITKNYYNGLFVFEDCENERFRNKDPEVLKMIVRSYARHISTEAAKTTIIKDVRQSNERTMDPKTFDDYMEALRDLYILEDMQAWNPNIRSKTSIRSTPTRHFVDTSIACRALNISPEDLKNDLESFGLNIPQTPHSSFNPILKLQFLQAAFVSHCCTKPGASGFRLSPPIFLLWFRKAQPPQKHRFRALPPPAAFSYAVTFLKALITASS